MRLRADLVRAATLAAMLGVAACSGGEERPSRAAGPAGLDDTPRVGPPYSVNGQTYTPTDDMNYDVVGVASWYGDEHQGQRTASGETFDKNAISAAHTTLPLPSYAEVTSLETGTIILVRINDRGPFVRGRIIDLSQGAARLLGIENSSNPRVRVRRIMPSEPDRAALRAGRPASERLPAPPQLIAGLNARMDGRATPSLPLPPRPIGNAGAIVGTTPVPPSAPAAPPPPVSAPVRPTSGGQYIQVAAFSDRARADRLAQSLADIGPTEIVPAGAVFRVRLGPAGSQDAARMLAEVRRRGYQDARIVR